jgi:regulator of protease activity HflC (stomatin/prohibitin superfamily)
MISLLSSAITALVSLIVFLNAPQLAKNNQTRSIRLGSLLVGCLASLLFIYKFIGQFLVIIPSGEVGLVQMFGQSSQKSLIPGLHWINPLGRVRTFSTRLVDIKETVDSTSKEGAGFKLDVSLQYRLDPDRVSDVYKNLGDNQKQIISSRFRSLIRQITARHNLKDIYGDQRVVIANDLAQAMTKQLKPLGFIVEATLLRNVILPENIQVAIQQKKFSRNKK